MAIHCHRLKHEADEVKGMHEEGVHIDYWLQYGVHNYRVYIDGELISSGKSDSYVGMLLAGWKVESERNVDIQED